MLECKKWRTNPSKDHRKIGVIRQQQLDQMCCDEWKRSPTVNPITGKNIKPFKTTWKKLEKICREKHIQSPKKSKREYKNYKISQYEDPLRRGKFKEDYTFETPECKQWQLDDSINPFTKRKIQYGKSTWQYFSRKCAQQKRGLLQPPNRSRSRSKSPINNKSQSSSEKYLHIRKNILRLDEPYTIKGIRLDKSYSKSPKPSKHNKSPIRYSRKRKCYSCG